MSQSQAWLRLSKLKIVQIKIVQIKQPILSFFWLQNSSYFISLSLIEVIWLGNSNDKPWAYCSTSHLPPGLLINKFILGPDHFRASVMFLSV